ncbi:hypothetical protein MAPG_10015 [Magnaporthiopsis poae ATCC 64411]|uniref:Uncharacterized protein n=1 Tax=Magnaporthiopsis poae (strain ATCC 64411 / 73-15) TaxID=644358 RepID=A0A0C4EBG8_MAGP6|nr:hypothetical protein MAPG_10015 [Magnaporthiopsis poae ATCC 64411]
MAVSLCFKCSRKPRCWHPNVRRRHESPARSRSPGRRRLKDDRGQAPHDADRNPDTLIICKEGDLTCKGTLLVTPTHLCYNKQVPEAVEFIASHRHGLTPSEAAAADGKDTPHDIPDDRWRLLRPRRDELGTVMSDGTVNVIMRAPKPPSASLLPTSE